MRQNTINFDEMDGRNVQDAHGNKFTIFQGDGWKCTCCHDGDAVVNFSGQIVECDTWTQAEESVNEFILEKNIERGTPHPDEWLE